MSITPFVSIITVVYNSRMLLEATIQSVINQSYKNYEYIIIDGASTDGTTSIIKKYDDHITKWISEADNGLYDAMNKGLRLASGKYVWFINSGDCLYATNTLQQIADKVGSKTPSMIYGDTLLIDNSGNEMGMRRHTPPAKLNYNDFKRGMLVSHQSMLVELSEAPLFDCSYKYSSDYDWTLNVVKQKGDLMNTDLILSKFLEGGQTSKTIIPGLKERFRIMTKNYGLLSTVLNHIPIAFRFFYFYIKNKRF